MADVSISGLTALGAAPATNDLLVTVDVDDTTQAPTGTTKKMTVANLFTAPAISAPVISSGMTATGVVGVGQQIVALTGDLDLDSQPATAGTVRVNRSGGTGGFTVFAGNTTTANFSVSDAGVVSIRSDFAIATNKFTVAASTGNTVVAGTLTVASTVTLTTGALTVSSGAIQALANSISAGSFVSAIGGKVQLTGTPFTTSISTSPTNCTVSANTAGALAFVNGSDGTNRFADLVFYSQSTVTVLASQTLAAAPAARTYTCASGGLKLAMGSGTYNVYAQELQNTTNA